MTIRVLGPGPSDPPGPVELLESEDEPEIPF
jgi:hypothetical protein